MTEKKEIPQNAALHKSQRDIGIGAAILLLALSPLTYMAGTQKNEEVKKAQADPIALTESFRGACLSQHAATAIQGKLEKGRTDFTLNFNANSENVTKCAEKKAAWRIESLETSRNTMYGTGLFMIGFACYAAIGAVNSQKKINAAKKNTPPAP